MPRVADAPRVEIVIAACRELVSAPIFNASLPRNAFRTTIYCKCGARSFCDHDLPNVGREGHVHLHHIVNRYESLADLTIFLNGGIAAEMIQPCVGRLCTPQRAARALTGRELLADILRASRDDPDSLSRFYSDGSGSANQCYTMRRAATPIRGTRGLANRADEALGEGPSGKATSPATLIEHWRRQCTAAAMARQCAAERCRLCTSFDMLHCANRTRCACGEHVGCWWAGQSKANRATVAQQVLPSATPASFAAWACAHFGVPLSVVSRCGWNWGGSFAAGASNIRARTVDVYRGALAQLEAGGVSGGMAVHYMERLWRTLLLCSISTSSLASNSSSP